MSFPKLQSWSEAKPGLADYRALAFIHKIIAPQGYWEETNGRLETLGTQQFIPDQALVLVFKRRPPQRPSSEFTRLCKEAPVWIRQGSPPHMNRTRENPTPALPPADETSTVWTAAPPWPPPCCVALGESPTFSGPYILTCAQEFGQGLVSPPRNLKACGDGRTGLKPHYVERECNWKLGQRRESMTVARVLLRGTRPHTHRSLADIRWRRRTTLSVEIRNACAILGKSLDLSELPLPGL